MIRPRRESACTHFQQTLPICSIRERVVVASLSPHVPTRQRPPHSYLLPPECPASPTHTPRPPRSSASSPAKKKYTQANNTASTSTLQPRHPAPARRCPARSSASRAPHRQQKHRLRLVRSSARSLCALHPPLTLEDAQRVTTHRPLPPRLPPPPKSTPFKIRYTSFKRT
jgi:hypothetical protein